MTRPHVVVVSTLAAPGGAERSMLELVRALRSLVRFTLVLPARGPLEAMATDAGAEVSVLAWPPQVATLGERRQRPSLRALAAAGLTLPAIGRDLRALLEDLAPDLVISNGIKGHVLATLASGGRWPVVWYAREGMEGRPFSQAVLRSLGAQSAGVIAISRYVADDMRRLVPRQRRIAVVHNPVDLETFRPGVAAPTDVCRAPGEIWFGVIGALTPLKGQDVFLAAAARVVSELPGARFLIVGGNPYATETGATFEAQLRRQVVAAGLADHVRFLGPRDDVPAIVANLDVLVQPNRGPEGLGRSVLEAMACGVPVIAPDRWGLRDIVFDGQTGRVWRSENVAELAAHMTALGRDPALCQRLGATGRAWVTAHVGRAQVARQFLDFVRPWLEPTLSRA